MAEWKLATAEALSPLLSNFRRIDGQTFRTVRRVYDQGSLARVILDFDHISLTIEARSEDDEVWTEEITAIPKVGIEADRSQPWSTFIGKTFGWGWVTINQQGYCDGVLLSFDDITPQVMLNVVASSIKESKLG